MNNKEVKISETNSTKQPANSLPTRGDSAKLRQIEAILAGGRDIGADEKGEVTLNGVTGAFTTDLAAIINQHSMENGSDTPDFLLARFLSGCLGTWNKVVKSRENWYQHKPAEAEDSLLEAFKKDIDHSQKIRCHQEASLPSPFTASEWHAISLVIGWCSALSQRDTSEDRLRRIKCLAVVNAMQRVFGPGYHAHLEYVLSSAKGKDEITPLP